MAQTRPPSPRGRAACKPRVSSSSSNRSSSGSHIESTSTPQRARRHESAAATAAGSRQHGGLRLRARASHAESSHHLAAHGYGGLRGVGAHNSFECLQKDCPCDMPGLRCGARRGAGAVERTGLENRRVLRGAPWVQIPPPPLRLANPHRGRPVTAHAARRLEDGDACGRPSSPPARRKCPRPPDGCVRSPPAHRCGRWCGAGTASNAGTAGRGWAANQAA